ncbi:MAG TPA: hypothetical protein DIC42_03030 [Holosporales bacterium]|nr:hypothetical protein [Holosporales bacterium]
MTKKISSAVTFLLTSTMCSASNPVDIDFVAIETEEQPLGFRDQSLVFTNKGNPKEENISSKSLDVREGLSTQPPLKADAEKKTIDDFVLASILYGK